MSKMDEIWDSAYEIPEGAIVPEGTELVQREAQYGEEFDELNIYKASVTAPWPWSPKNAPVRSIEPLPDPDDTGALRFYGDGGHIILEGVHCGHGHSLSIAQARNLARKITEAIDEH